MLCFAQSFSKAKSKKCVFLDRFPFLQTFPTFTLNRKDTLLNDEEDCYFKIPFKGVSFFTNSSKVR